MHFHKFDAINLPGSYLYQDWETLSSSMLYNPPRLIRQRTGLSAKIVSFLPGIRDGAKNRGKSQISAKNICFRSSLAMRHKLQIWENENRNKFYFISFHFDERERKRLDWLFAELKHPSRNDCTASVTQQSQRVFFARIEPCLTWRSFALDECAKLEFEFPALFPPSVWLWPSAPSSVESELDIPSPTWPEGCSENMAWKIQLQHDECRFWALFSHFLHL